MHDTSAVEESDVNKSALDKSRQEKLLPSKVELLSFTLHTFAYLVLILIELWYTGALISGFLSELRLCLQYL